MQHNQDLPSHLHGSRKVSHFDTIYWVILASFHQFHPRYLLCCLCQRNKHNKFTSDTLLQTYLLEDMYCPMTSHTKLPFGIKVRQQTPYWNNIYIAQTIKINLCSIYYAFPVPGHHHSSEEGQVTRYTEYWTHEGTISILYQPLGWYKSCAINRKGLY